MRNLFLAMTNLGTHSTFFPTHFTAAFSGPFCSHLSNLLICIGVLYCVGCFARPQILDDFAKLDHP